ncbi:MAG: FecCD family ABC transporter permease, partial [Nannocystaceae bacterium]
MGGEVKHRNALAIGLSCALVLLVAPWVGAPMDDGAREFILSQLRIPRVCMGILVGAVLGITGATYQTIFTNPLATPSTVGTSAGATLGALAVLVLSQGGQVVGLPVLVIAAFVGATAASLLAIGVAASGRASSEDIILAGIAVTLATSALAMGLQFQADIHTTFAAVRWSLGSLTVVGYERVLVFLPIAIVCVVSLLVQVRALGALASGAERARTQGVDVVRVRTVCLLGGALGVGAAVALCGPIAFVGLIVPHLVRRSLGGAHRILLPYSALVGASLLVVCDVLGRTAWPGREI